MKSRPFTDFPRNEQGLVDNYIGTAYDVVKNVSNNLPELRRLDGVLGEIDDLAEVTVNNAVSSAMIPVRAELAETTQHFDEVAERINIESLVNATNVLVTARGTENRPTPDMDYLNGFAGRTAYMAKPKVAFAPALTAGTTSIPLSSFIGDSVDPQNFTGFSISVLRNGIATPIEFVYKPADSSFTLSGAQVNDVPIAIERDTGGGSINTTQMVLTGISKSIEEWFNYFLNNQSESTRRVDSIFALNSLPVSGKAIVTVSSYSPGWAATVKGAQGGGMFTWDSERPKTEHNGIWIFSNTVPWDGSYAAIPAFQSRIGETNPTGKGCWVRLFNGPVQMEMAGVAGYGDEGVLLQRAVASCYKDGLSLEGHGSYTSSTELTITTYRTDPAVYRDFNLVSMFLNKLTYTGTNGRAVFVGSPTARVHIRRLLGPGNPTITTTDGLHITGLGDGHHRVDWVGGFTNGINFNDSYSNSLEVGWVEDCIRGIRVNGNQTQIHGGHIGGGYVTAAINPLSCEIGIDIIAGSSSTYISSNVEYCRRSETSIGIRDSGTGTRFVGYTESCSAYNIMAFGKDGRFDVLAGGTNVNSEASGYHASTSNHIHLLAQINYAHQVVNNANSTLTYQILQEFSMEGGGTISGDNGFRTVFGVPGVISNKVIQSNNIASTSWGKTVLGSALWSNVAMSTTPVSLPELGNVPTTKMVFPAVADETAVYRCSQSNLTLTAKDWCMGVFVKGEEGVVEVQVRVVYGIYQTVMPVKLAKGSGWMQLGSVFDMAVVGAYDDVTFELTFRSKKGGTILIGGAYLQQSTDVVSPIINSGIVRSLIGGRPIVGNLLQNGMILTGSRVEQYGLINAAATINAAALSVPGFLLDSAGGAFNINLSNDFMDGTIISLKRVGGSGTITLFGTIDGAASLALTGSYDRAILMFTVGYGFLRIG